MISALVNLALLHVGDLTLAMLLSPPPLDPTNLLKDIFTWLVRILGRLCVSSCCGHGDHAPTRM